MQRITIVLGDELAAAVDDLVAHRGYQSRSEAIRDLARSG
ncbi:MAG: ribbon-helix-helix protein, CopG family [Proteobacteria bacterium]|nr:ribbon-helix-helix protein, CopG family [Pseudomonadota bacterium]